MLDEVGKFVRDFDHWRQLNDTHIKEDLLATRVAKAKKEFDVAHRTELQDLENKLVAEGLLKEVKDLGHWSTSPLFQYRTEMQYKGPVACGIGSRPVAL